MTSDDGDGDTEVDGDTDRDGSTQQPTVAPRARRERVAPARLGRFEVRPATGATDALAAIDAAGRVYEVVVLDVRRDRQLRQARALAGLSHPNLVAHELADDGTTHAFVAELLADSMLLPWLAAQPRPWRAVVALFATVARALAAAHDAGAAHRDVAARHIAIGPHDAPRLGGFRLPGQRVAAPVHLAPELRVAATADLRTTGTSGGVVVAAGDARADQYALCAALWQALYDAEPPVRARRDVPPAVIAALERGLAAAPGDRFATMSELADQLDAAARTRRPRIAIIAAIVIAVAAAAIAVASTNTSGSATAVDPAIATAHPHADYTAELARIAQLSEPAAVLLALDALPPDALQLPAAGELATDAVTAGPIRTIDEASRITALAMSVQSNQPVLVVGTTTDIVIHWLDGSRPDRHVPVAAPTALYTSWASTMEFVAVEADGLVEMSLEGNVQRYAGCPDHGHVLDVLFDPFAVVCPTTLPSGRAGQAVYALSSDSAKPRLLRRGLEVVGVNAVGEVAMRTDDNTLEVSDRHLDGWDNPIHHAVTPGALVSVNTDGVAIASGRSLTWWESFSHLGADGQRTATAPDAHYHAPFDGLDWLGAQQNGLGIIVWASRATGDAVFVAPPSPVSGAWHAGAPIVDIAIGSETMGPIVVRTTNEVEEIDTESGIMVRSTNPELRGTSRLVVSSGGGTVAVAHDTRIAVWMSHYGIPRTLVFRHFEDLHPALSTDGADVAVPLDHSVTVDTLAVDAQTTIQRGARYIAYASDRSLAAIGDDGAVWTWRDDATRSLGTVADARDIVAVASDRAIVIDTSGRLHAVRDGGEQLACGGRVASRVAGDTAVVAGDRGSDGLLLCNIAAGVVRALPPADSWTLSPDGSHVAGLTGGEVTVLRAADLAQLRFPRVTGVTAIAFDTSGTHMLATTPTRLAVATDTGTEPIVLASSAGAGTAAISADGTRVAGRLGDDIVAWDVEDPTRARPVGRLLDQGPTRPGDLVVTAQQVVLAHLDIFGWRCVTSWRIGPTSPAEMRGIRRYLGP